MATAVVLDCEGLRKSYGERVAGRGRVHDRGGRDVRAARSERRRQDHHDLHGVRTALAGRGTRDAQRPRARHRHGRGEGRRGVHAPGDRDLPRTRSTRSRSRSHPSIWGRRRAASLSTPATTASGWCSTRTVWHRR